MDDMADIRAKADELNMLLREKFGVRRGDLADRLRRAGRDVPAAIRQDVAQVAQAAHLAGHPRLAAQIDTAAVAAAHGRARAGLRAIDLSDRRKGRLLSLTATLIVNLGLLVVLLVAVLAWRGFL